MKKLSMLLMAVVLTMSTLAGCSSTPETPVATVTAGEVVAQMVDKGFVRMPMEINETMAQEMYRIDLATVENYAVAETGISPGPGLIVVAKAKDGQVDTVKANMEQLLQDKVGNAFYPEEKDAADSAEVIVNGPYVGLIIVNNEVKADALKMFDELTK